MSSSASALALPQLLPITKPVWTGKNASAKPTIEAVGGVKIVCEGYSADGEQKTDNEGMYHLHFTGCEDEVGGVKTKCNTASDAAGVVLVLGTYSYVPDALSPPILGVAVLLSISAHLVCTGLVLVKVLGSVLCLEGNPLVSSMTATFKCTQTAGAASEKKFFDDLGGEKNTIQLLVSINGGAFKEAALLTEAAWVFTEAVAFMSPY